jgi:levanase/fructan beta-fructosidase
LEEIGAHGGVGNAHIFPIQVEGTDEYKWVMLLSINPGEPILYGKTFTIDESFAKDVKQQKVMD